MVIPVGQTTRPCVDVFNGPRANILIHRFRECLRAVSDGNSVSVVLCFFGFAPPVHRRLPHPIAYVQSFAGWCQETWRAAHQSPPKDLSGVDIAASEIGGSGTGSRKGQLPLQSKLSRCHQEKQEDKPALDPNMSRNPETGLAQFRVKNRLSSR